MAHPGILRGAWNRVVIRSPGSAPFSVMIEAFPHREAMQLNGIMAVEAPGRVPT